MNCYLATCHHVALLGTQPLESKFAVLQLKSLLWVLKGLQMKGQISSKWGETTNMCCPTSEIMAIRIIVEGPYYSWERTENITNASSFDMSLATGNRKHNRNTTMLIKSRSRPCNTCGLRVQEDPLAAGNRHFGDRVIFPFMPPVSTIQ